MASAKIIPDFPNYSITDSGEVWSKKSQKWLRLGWDKDGYKIVILRRDEKSFTRRVHRLVLEVFTGSCPKGMESCHNNGNNLDNRLENLRWDTRSNNSYDSIRHGTHAGTNIRGENHYRSKLTKEKVIGIIQLYNTRLFTQQELADLSHVGQSVISRIINRRTWKHI